MKIKLLKKIIRLGDSSWGITLTARKINKYFSPGDVVWITIERADDSKKLVEYLKENITELQEQVEKIKQNN